MTYVCHIGFDNVFLLHREDLQTHLKNILRNYMYLGKNLLLFIFTFFESLVRLEEREDATVY